MSNSWDPVDCGPQGFSVYGIFQTRILDWVCLLLHGIFPTQELNHGFPALQADSLLTELPGLEMPSFKYWLMIKGKIVILWQRDLADTTLTKWITCNKIYYQHTISADIMHWEGTPPLCFTSPKCITSNLIKNIRQTQIQGYSATSRLVLIKKCQGHEKWGKIREDIQRGQADMTIKCNGIQDWILEQ